MTQQNLGRSLAASVAFLCVAFVADAARGETSTYVPARLVTASGVDNASFIDARCGGGMDCHLAMPQEAVSDSAGNIIVVDSANRLVKAFDQTGQTLVALYGKNDGSNFGNPLGQPGSPCAIYGEVPNPGPLQRTDCFTYPTGVAVDSRDRIYVTDPGNHRVMVFCPVANVTGQASASAVPGCPIMSPPTAAATSLQFITAFGVFGGPTFDAMTGELVGPMGADGQLDQPYDVAVDRNADGSRHTDRVFVLDTFNQRVQAFDLAIDQTVPGAPVYRYSFALKFGSPGPGAGQFAFPQGLGV